MSKQIYKVYNTNDKAMIFTSLTALRQAFDLTPEETSRCFIPGVHTVAFGIQVITY